MRTLIKKFEGFASLFDYCISHQQLLFRSSYSENGKHYNTDFLFEGVYYLQTVTNFSNPFEIYQGDDEDKKHIASITQSEIYSQFGFKVYVIKDKGKEYFVGAISLKIVTNDLPSDQTSIEMKKDWYIPKTYEENKAQIEHDQMEFDRWYMQFIKDSEGNTPLANNVKDLS